MAGIQEPLTSPDSNLTDTLFLSDMPVLMTAKKRIKAKPAVMRVRMPKSFRFMVCSVKNQRYFIFAYF